MGTGTIAEYNMEQRNNHADKKPVNSGTQSQSPVKGLDAKGADLPYYNFDRVYSYGGVFVFVCGARGLGKTFGAKKKVINKFLRKGEQFIYLRRYKTELKAARTFFDDIGHQWPEYRFRVNGNQFEVCREPKKVPKENKWEVMGFAIALSTAQNQKSVAFPMVRTIIFDEFIIEKGMVHYLPDEATVLTNFYSTVDRNRNNTIVLFLANSVSIENPYFIRYKIRPDQVGDLITSHNGFIVAHFVDSKEFSTAVYKTRFGQFIKDSEYADYALGNQFSDNHQLMIRRKPWDAEYAYTLETGEGTFSVWYHRKEGDYYLQEKRPGQELKYTLLANKVDRDNKLLLRNDDILKMLRSAFKNGMMYFDEPHTRNAMLNVFI